MQGDNYATIAKYLDRYYKTGYVGTMYDISGFPVHSRDNSALQVMSSSDMFNPTRCICPLSFSGAGCCAISFARLARLF